MSEKVNTEIVIFDDEISVTEFDEYEVVYHKGSTNAYRKINEYLNCGCVCGKCNAVMKILPTGFKCPECEKKVTFRWVLKKLNTYYDENPLTFNKEYIDIYGD